MINKDINKIIKKKKINNKGFSLVEVIVAMTILVVISIPIIDTFSGSLKLTHKGSDKQRATLLGQSITEGVKRLDVGDLCKAFHTSTSGGNFAVLDGNRFTFTNKYRLELTSHGTYSPLSYNLTDKNLDNERIYYYGIEGIESGTATYDALITLDSDGYKDLNGQAFPELVKVGSECTAIIDCTGRLNGMKFYEEYCKKNGLNTSIPFIEKLACDISLCIVKAPGEEYNVFANIKYRSQNYSTVTFRRVGDISFDEVQKLKYIYVFLNSEKFRDACSITAYVDIEGNIDNIPIALVTSNCERSGQDIIWKLHANDVDDCEVEPLSALGTKKWKDNISFMSNDFNKYVQPAVGVDITDYSASGKKLKKIYDMSVQLFNHTDDATQRFQGDPIEEINSSYLRYIYVQ